MPPNSAILIVAGVLLSAPASADMPPQPYAGQQIRAIKALSDDDVGALRRGEGLGMAKAAELNGYPGPAHVLALADKLGLTDAQRRQVAAIHDRMSAAARRIGHDLIERERTLDQLFSDNDAKQDRIAVETAAIGALQGKLRAVHLTAHVETRSLLTADQISLYQHLRGHGGPAESRQHSHG